MDRLTAGLSGLSLLYSLVLNGCRVSTNEYLSHADTFKDIAINSLPSLASLIMLRLPIEKVMFAFRISHSVDILKPNDSIEFNFLSDYIFGFVDDLSKLCTGS
jgi:hypothetical protein